MSPDREDDRLDEEPAADAWDTEPPRTLLGQTWFKVLLVVIVIGAVAAVSVPYVLDSVSPPVVTSPPAVRSQARSSPTPTMPAVPSPASPLPSSTAPPAIIPPGPATKTEPPPATSGAQATTPPASPVQAPLPAAKPEPRSAAVKASTVTSQASSSEAKPAASKATVNSPSKPAAKSETAPRADERRAGTSSGDDTSTRTIGGERGHWWVQIGAFRDVETARQVAAALQKRNYRVRETIAGGGVAAPPANAPTGAAESDRYDVLVRGPTPTEVVSKLAAKGVSAEAAPEGAVIRPSLPLREAVAVSRELSKDGFQVQVKRSDASRGSSTSTSPTAEAVTLHRVRVGAFEDRAAAVDVLRRLEAQGYRPFVTRGDE